MDLQNETEWLQLFLQFIKYLRIDSKHVESEGTQGAEFRLWTSQNMFLSELAKGLSRGVRVFYCLKSRQLGVTTISLAIDIFWLAMHPGTVGCLVIDREDNRNIFRSVIKRYIKSFPKGFFGKAFEIVKGGDNRNFMLFSNGSRLDFLVAGTRRNTSWAEGKGYAFAHLTEVAAYGDSRGLDSFKESMTDVNPNRLYIYESTAKGHNHWYDMYEEAKRDTLTKHCFFIGWWANDMNRIAKTDPRFAIYGAEAATEEETPKIEWVKTKAGLIVTKEQLSWLRWRESDTSQDKLQLNQDQPWNDKECFVQSGQSFFDSTMINKDLQIVNDIATKPKYHGFKYHLGDDFHLSSMEEIFDQWRVEAGEIQLRMWERPVVDAYYAIGVDAALGRNDEGDRNTIEVFRCYADRLVQVAEYASNLDDTRECAWILAYLAGIYTNCRINIDVTGGHGIAIMNELEQLRVRMRTEMYTDLTTKINSKVKWDDFLSSASWYLYHRPDSLGAGYAKGWVWTARTKWWACNSYRDSYACGMLIVASKFLLEEMNDVVRDGLEVGAPISAKGRKKDDRVFAAVLAEVAWKDWVRPGLIARNYSYEKVNGAETATQADRMADMTKNIVYNFFQRQQDAADEFDDRPQWRVERGL